MTSMRLPPDRSHVRTEHRHPRSGEMDALPAAELVELIVEDHAAVVRAVREAGPALAALIEQVVERARQGGRLVYVGAGTSGRLGVLDASECPPTFQSDPAQVVGLIAGGDPALRRSSEGREDEADGAAEEFDRLGLGALDTVVGIAAGGTTPYVLGAIRLAKSRGALTAFMVCTPTDRAEACDHLIVLDTGPEVLTGSTRLKAGSATKLALNCITTALFTRLGKVYGNLMVDLAATNDKLVDRAIRTLRLIDPSLGREDALALLRQAGNRVKTAIVMRKLGLPREQAEQRLADAKGRLRDVIG
jgi:N-acetylmuramic acid 6-phosphate etherase